MILYSPLNDQVGVVVKVADVAVVVGVASTTVFLHVLSLHKDLILD